MWGQDQETWGQERIAEIKDCRTREVNEEKEKFSIFIIDGQICISLVKIIIFILWTEKKIQICKAQQIYYKFEMRSLVFTSSGPFSLVVWNWFSAQCSSHWELMMRITMRVGLKILTQGENHPGSHLAYNTRIRWFSHFEKGLILTIKNKNK